MKQKKYRLLMMAVICTLGISGIHFGGVKESMAKNSPVQTEQENIQTDAKENTSKEKIYAVGSVSKVYVTTAIMQLSEEEKVNLDAPVTEYIPDFKMADDRYQKITVRMLMDHTSGIMGTSYKNMMLYDDNDMSSHDELLTYLAGQRLKAEPGAYAAYCNDGFALLELIVENVSGISYTEYLETHIADKIGAEETGTPVNRFQMEDAVSIYKSGNTLYDYDYCMNIGSGGVVATASEVAEFGATFFKGNNTLLSEKSKDEMAKQRTEDSYMDGNGLGWDYVEFLQYQEAGVKVLEKGGDIDNQHAWLVVAPEEEISVSVLSSGGSSLYNAMMAHALLNVALEEKGIYIEDINGEMVETVFEVPEEYIGYEGYYTTGSEVWNISFPDKKYMHLEKISADITISEEYMFTKDGKFVRMEDELREWALAGYPEQKLSQDYNQVILAFEEAENGKVFIKQDELIAMNGLGNYVNKTYVAENLEENPISEELKDAWERRCNRDFGVYDQKYSSTGYDYPIGKMVLSEEIPGYLFVSIGGAEKLLKITGTDTAEAFISIPSSGSRDLCDLKMEEVIFKNGTSNEVISGSVGQKHIFMDIFPEFTKDIKEISLYSEEAGWYHIGDDVAGTRIILDRPEESAVYVYNKYGEMVYSTHMQDWTGGIPLPKDGSIVFLGEDGGKIKISQ